MKLKPRFVAGIFGTLWFIIIGIIDKLFNLNLYENIMIWIIPIILGLIIYSLLEKKYYDNKDDY